MLDGRHSIEAQWPEYEYPVRVAHSGCSETLLVVAEGVYESGTLRSWQSLVADCRRPNRPRDPPGSIRSEVDTHAIAVKGEPDTCSNSIPRSWILDLAMP